MVDSKSRAPARWRRLLLLGLVGSGSVACDLQAKAWAWDNLRDGTDVSVIDPLFELTFAFNTGSAFSVVREGAVAHTIFLIVAFAALAWMVYAAVTMPTERRLGFVGIGLIAAGTIGNTHDRLFRFDELGRAGVVDFMQINYPWGGHWPIFNVADVALLVGLGLLLLTAWRHGPASVPRASRERHADRHGRPRHGGELL